MVKNLHLDNFRTKEKNLYVLNLISEFFLSGTGDGDILMRFLPA